MKKRDLITKERRRNISPDAVYIFKILEEAITLLSYIN